jgi:hypothetical protein
MPPSAITCVDAGLVEVTDARRRRRRIAVACGTPDAEDAGWCTMPGPHADEDADRWSA